MFSESPVGSNCSVYLFLLAETRKDMHAPSFCARVVSWPHSKSLAANYPPVGPLQSWLDDWRWSKKSSCHSATLGKATWPPGRQNAFRANIFLHDSFIRFSLLLKTDVPHSFLFQSRKKRKKTPAACQKCIVYILSHTVELTFVDACKGGKNSLTQHVINWQRSDKLRIDSCPSDETNDYRYFHVASSKNERLTEK